jgi:hypothetical protein
MLEADATTDHLANPQPVLRRVEMRAGDRTESENERDEHSAVPSVLASNPIATFAPASRSPDARPNHGGQQKGSPDRLRSNPPCKCHAQHPGKQQLAGFVARIKALIICLSSGKHMASTPIPSLEGKACASSSWSARVNSISTGTNPAFAPFPISGIGGKPNL